MQAALRARGFATSVSTADMARFDLDGRGLPALLRASVHCYNTEDDVARFAAAVATIRAPAGIARRGSQVAVHKPVSATLRPLDTPPDRGHVPGMQPVRALIFAVLMLLMMPWGAYARVAAGDLPARYLPTTYGPEYGPVAAETGAAETGAAKTIPAPVRATLIRNCPGATLPGSPCGVELILAAAAAAARGESRVALPLPVDLRPARSLSPTPPRAPPRGY
ncbi:hypothetical protein [Halovulum marinum]|nr:hypothetical protein [Halovulum marinum]